MRLSASLLLLAAVMYAAPCGYASSPPPSSLSSEERCLDSPDFKITRGWKKQRRARTCDYIGALPTDRPWRLKKWCNKRYRGELIKEICCSTCDACLPDPPNCGCDKTNQADYRGTISTTHLGTTCQRWDVQSPHSHTRTPENYPSSGLEENYCRNPDGENATWCYTTDSEVRWNYCGVPICPSV